MPICISWSNRANSPAIGPSVLRATWAIAASKPRPASTEIVSRSMASGRSFCICWVRFVPLLCTHTLTATYPKRAAPTQTTRRGMKPMPI